VSLSTTGAALPHSLPATIADPVNVAEDADATHMWFDADAGRARLGDVTANGTFVDFPVPGDSSTICLVLGPDRRLYVRIS